MATDVEWAWFGGWFEGEGSISLTGVHSVRLMASCTDLDVLKRVQRTVGGSISIAKKYEATHRPKWVWYVAHQDKVLPILAALRPYLGARRLARLEEAEKRLSNVRRHGYCKYGHPMDGENLYVSPHGVRQCRTCNKRRDGKRKAKHRTESSRMGQE